MSLLKTFALGIALSLISYALWLSYWDLVTMARCQEKGWPTGNVTIFGEEFCTDVIRSEPLEGYHGPGTVPRVQPRKFTPQRNLPVPVRPPGSVEISERP